MNYDYESFLVGEKIFLPFFYRKEIGGPFFVFTLFYTPDFGSVFVSTLLYKLVRSFFFVPVYPPAVAYCTYSVLYSYKK